jgi:hypothetical protein
MKNGIPGSRKTAQRNSLWRPFCSNQRVRIAYLIPVFPNANPRNGPHHDSNSCLVYRKLCTFSTIDMHEIGEWMSRGITKPVEMRFLPSLHQSGFINYICETSSSVHNKNRDLHSHIWSSDMILHRPTLQQIHQCLVMWRHCHAYNGYEKCFDWFIGKLHLQLGIISNYCCTANPRTLQSTTARTVFSGLRKSPCNGSQRRACGFYGLGSR